MLDAVEHPAGVLLAEADNSDFPEVRVRPAMIGNIQAAVPVENHPLAPALPSGLVRRRRMIDRPPGAPLFEKEWHAGRRALIAAIGLWFVGLVWCVTVMILRGYVSPADRPTQPDLLFGMPSWVVWGLFIPWIAQIAAVWWFAICWLKDDEPFQEFPAEQ